MEAASIEAARVSFEASKRKLWAEVQAKVDALPSLCQGDMFGQRLQRGADGEYLNPHDRLDFHRWCEAWEAGASYQALVSWVVR